MADDLDDVRQIVTLLDVNNNSEIIYTPSTKVLEGVSIKYYGLINSLKLNAYIGSLAQIVLPPIDPALGYQGLEDRNNELRNSPHKAVKLSFLKGLDEMEIGLVPIYPNRPRFSIDLMAYFSNLEIFPIQHGISLKVDIINNGYGVLEGNDFISIFGSVVENTKIYFNTTNNLPVNTVTTVSS